jgi:SagB-type dehydrogenase family enzyme
MFLPYVLAFKGGVSLLPSLDEGAVLHAAGREVALRQLSPALVAALLELSSGGSTAERLGAAVERDEGPTAAAKLFYFLERFRQLGLLTYQATWERGPLATLLPLTTSHPVAPEPIDLDARYVLSRFACVRRRARDLVLESPLGHGTTLLHHHHASAIGHLLSRPCTVAELGRELPDLSVESIAMLLGLFLGGRAVAAEGADDEVLAPALATWSFHDLLFHARSRRGRHADPYGGTFPFQGKLEPLPAVKPPTAGALTPLRRPDIDMLSANDVPFTRVLESRRSIRRHGARPLHIDELGELLYRSARIRALQGAESPYTRTDRPYPGGGACHELELYVAVNTCDGLAPGLHHYRPIEHALSAVAGPTPAVHALLAQARTSERADHPPQTLIILSARFQRVTWKYESMAYALILKDVGVLYQTLYLVATAMDLAPCALGGGDSDLFAAAAGLDYYAETSVGELILGSRPE